MPKSPFDRLSGAQGGRSTVSYGDTLGPIDTTPNTQVSTRDIGRLSIDLSGPKGTETLELMRPFQSPLDVPGRLLEGLGNVGGALLGGVGQALQIGGEKLIYEPAARGKIERYIQRRDFGPLMPKQTDIIRDFGDWFAVAADPFNPRRLEKRMEFDKWLESQDVPAVVKGVVKPLYGVAEVGAMGAAVVAAGRIGGPTQLGLLGAPGKVLGGTLGAGAVARAGSTDPEELPTAVKAMLDNGATPDEAVEWMRQNYQWYGDDMATNLVTQIYVDPLNKLGSFISPIGKWSGVEDAARLTGRSFSEIAASQGMSKSEVAIAKRMGMLTSAYRRSASVPDKVKEIIRGDTAVAVKDVLRMETFAKIDALANEIGGTAPELIRRGVNRTLQYTITDAMKAPLTRTAVENSRAYADLVLVTAGREGADGLRQLEGFQGVSDDYVNKILSTVEAYYKSKGDEELKKLEELQQLLAENKNIQYLNSELSGPILRKMSTRLPVLGKMMRSEVIGAGRLSLLRSLQRFEGKIASYLTDPLSASSQQFRANFINQMKTVFDSAANGGEDIIQRFANKELDAAVAAWSSGKKSEAVRDLARVLEVVRMGRFSRAIELAQAARRITKLKVTPVVDSRFSQQGLKQAITDLQFAIDSTDNETVAKTVMDIVSGNDDLAFKFDSVEFEAQVLADPIREAKDVLRHLKRLERTGAYVSRIPEELSAKLDFIESGGVADVTLGIDETPIAGGTMPILEAIYNTTIKTKAGGEKINNASMISPELRFEDSDALRNALESFGPENMHQFTNYNNGKWGDSGHYLQRVSEVLTDKEIIKIADASGGKIDDELATLQMRNNPMRQLNHISSPTTSPLPSIATLESLQTSAVGNAGLVPFGNPVITRALDPMGTTIPGVAKSLAEGDSYGDVSVVPLGFTERLLTRLDPGVQDFYLESKFPTGLLADENGRPVAWAIPTPSSYGQGVGPQASQIIWNRMNRLGSLSSPGGKWSHPLLAFGKANPKGGIKHYFSDADSFVPANERSFPYYYQNLNTYSSISGKEKLFIPGDTEEGVNTVLGLDSLARTEIFVDPGKMAVGYLLESSPFISVPKLDQMMLKLDESNQVKNIIELAGDDRAHKYASSLEHQVNVDLGSWISEYLTSSVQRAEIVNPYRVGDLIDEPGLKDLIAKHGASVYDVPAPELRKWVEESNLIERVRNSINQVHNNRKRYPGDFKNAYEETSFEDNTGSLSISFADLFHSLDTPAPSVSKVMTDAHKYDLLNYDAEFGNFSPRPFMFLSSADGVGAGIRMLVRKLKGLDAPAFDKAKELAKDVETNPQALSEFLYNQYVKYSGELVQSQVEKDLFEDLTAPSIAAHKYLEGLGSVADRRAAFAMGLVQKYKETTISNNQINPFIFQRIFDETGVPLLERRYTNVVPWDNPARTASYDSIYENVQAYPATNTWNRDFAGRFDVVSLAIKNGGSSVNDLLTAQKAAKAALPKEGSEEARLLQNDEQMQELVQLRAGLRDLGYEMGVEPKNGIIQGFDVVKNLNGQAVIRPRFDLYTSIDDEVDLSEFGMRSGELLPLVQKQTTLQKLRGAIVPISNNELYDLSVERLRTYLGNKVSREESLRIMSNLVERAVQQEIGPGGLTENEVADIVLNTFGTGERATRKYDRIFGAASGNPSPRAALLYALEGDPQTIGLTTNFSKRIQRANPALATMANKMFPLLRYRYNPYFNQQEALEPYAFTLLRGIRGEKAFRDGSMLAQVLSAPGSFRYDNHEVGAHVLRAGGSVLNEMGKKIPKLDDVVEKRISQIDANLAGKMVSYLVPVSNEMRQVIAARKLTAIDATALNEVKRNVGPMLAKEFPEFNEVMYQVTGSIDVAENVDALVDMHIYGTIPAKIDRIADVSSAAFTFGAPSRIKDFLEFKSAVMADNITPEALEQIEHISLKLDDLVSTDIRSRDQFIKAFKNYKNSIKKRAVAGAVPTKEGQYRGLTAVTTADEVGSTQMTSLRRWVSNGYESISKYLVAKNEFGVQQTVLAKDAEDMAAYASTMMGGNNPISEMDALVADIDKTILNNRVVIDAPLYRGVDLKRLVGNPDEIIEGDVLGYEPFASFSRDRNTALGFARGKSKPGIFIIQSPKGIPAFDLNAVGASHIDHEAEILLPRGTKYRVVTELETSGNVRVFVVEPQLQRNYQLAFDRFAPEESAKAKLEKAFNDIVIEDQRIKQSANLVERLLTVHPGVLAEVERMGVRFGDDIQKSNSVRRRRIGLPINPVKIPDPAPDAVADIYRGRVEFSEAPISGARNSEDVFGTKVQGPLANLNVGGDTGVWMGKDNVKRYAKRVEDPTDPEQKFAPLSEFINARLYRKMGVTVPQVGITVRNGDVYVVSDWVEGMTDWKSYKFGADLSEEAASRELMDNVAADLIIGNTDVVGTEFGNVGIMPDGRVVRIDLGSNAKYRARGQWKKAVWGEVNPSYIFKPDVGDPSPLNWKRTAIKAYPELAQAQTLTAVPDFLAQYSEMRTMLGDINAVIDDAANEVKQEMLKAAGMSEGAFMSEVESLKKIFRQRLEVMDVTANNLRAEKAALFDLPKLQAEKAKKIGMKNYRKATVNIGRRLAEAATRDELRLPGFELALSKMAKKEFLAPEEEMALGRGLANFLYQRAAVSDLVSYFKTAHVKGMEIAAREQLYNSYKGAFERTLNHPYLGFYPTSYMYGKILPAFINALFRYAPFTGEYAPFVGYRRFDLIADHVAAALETSPELQEYVNERPPLIMFLNGLLPGWPTDIGASLPYWLREGVMRPVAEGNFESIPGRIVGSVITTAERAVGPIQSIRSVTNAISDIQEFLTGDPQRSVIDEVSEFLAPRE